MLTRFDSDLKHKSIKWHENAEMLSKLVRTVKKKFSRWQHDVQSSNWYVTSNSRWILNRDIKLQSFEKSSKIS